MAVGALAGVGAVVAVLALLASGGDDSGTPTVGELFLEPISEVGPDPFTGSLVPDLPDLPSPEELLDTVTLPTAPAGAPEGAVTTISGAAPGLYGGTKQLSVCDATQLVSFLETNADKATAWAAAVGIPVEMIGAYVAGLTDVILQRDVRVTNHGFAEGQATSRQSVLQAGTAVLVDEFGVPRVRCYCGNPLLAPEPAKAEPELVGAPWPGFDATGVIVIQATDPVDEFVIRDLVEGGLLGRPPGTPATEATQIEAPPGGEATTSTTAATGPLQNLQPGATSSFSGTAGSFPAGLAFDGDPSTSWFSIGTGDPAPTLTAQALADTLFTEVSITGNGANRRAEFRTGFGFSSVDVVVTDVEGVEVFRETVQLPGTPDPTVTVRPGVVGRSLALVFHGHESPDCGGVAEVLILGSSA